MLLGAPFLRTRPAVRVPRAGHVESGVLVDWTVRFFASPPVRAVPLQLCARVVKNEPTGALLPNWLSGYGFVYPAGIVATRPRAPHSVAWTLSCDSSDPTARLAADRILLNAKDAGITLQIVNSDNADIRLVKVALPSADSESALEELARAFQLPAPTFANSSVSSLYSAETASLQTRRVIPIVYLRTGVAFRSNVHGLKLLPDGSWQLDNVWLSAETP